MADTTLTAREAVAALAHLGFPAMSPDTLRKWRERGHLGPGPGYDTDEIAALLRRRVTRNAA